jgi:hypothetical protein
LNKNYSAFVALDAQLTNLNTDVYEQVTGDFKNSSKGINSARNLFYDTLRGDNLTFENYVAALQEQKNAGNKMTEFEAGVIAKANTLDKIKKTAGGMAAVYLVNLNEANEISDNPNVNLRNKIKFERLYSYYLDQIYKIAAMNGVDINAKDIKSKRDIESITYQVFTQMHREHFYNAPDEPAGRIEDGAIVGGDRPKAGYKNVADKAKSWGN